jgi:hypothetical protein
MRACVRIQHESLAGKRSLAVGVRVSNVTRHDVTRNFFMYIQSPFFIACACNTVEHSSFMCMPASGVSISSLLLSASFFHVCDPSPSTQFSGFMSSLSCKTNEVHLPQHAAAVPSIHHTMHACMHHFLSKHFASSRESTWECSFGGSTKPKFCMQSLAIKS